MTDYPQFIAEQLAVPHPVSLDAGLPNRMAGERLRGVDATTLIAPRPVRDANMAAACLAGLWLRFDFLDESHTLSQQIETPEGSAWHAIMHRREGDFGNSKYWWRRVGKHPALIGDPFAFVDEVEEAAKRGKGNPAALRDRQQSEWESLFEFCLRGAIRKT
jgi:hypothetical protein